jgi:hypothetical protein
MRTMKRWVLAGAVTGVVVTLGGCKDAVAPSADDTLLTNVAAVAADATLEDVALATSPFGFGALPTPAQASTLATRIGTRSVTFYDADGNVQSAYDSLTTASIHFTLDVSRQVTRDTWSASVARSRDMTVSGLEGHETTRTFNGSGTETVSRSRTASDGTESSYDMAGTFTYEDVIVPVPGSESPWPLSGTITRHMTVNVVNGPNGDRTRDVTVVVTFDGTSTATATVNGRTIQIDLTTRPGRFPFRGAFGR